MPAIKLNRHESHDGKVGTFAYTTEDGRYTIRQDWFGSYCMDPHPVRISADHRKAIRAALAEHNYRAYDVIRFARVEDKDGISPDSDAIHAVAEGKRGYHCPGDQEHVHWAWTVWDNERDDYAGNTGVNEYETLKDAKEYLASWIEREQSVVA
jgi:hypothetical protein